MRLRSLDQIMCLYPLASINAYFMLFNLLFTRGVKGRPVAHSVYDDGNFSFLRQHLNSNKNAFSEFSNHIIHIYYILWTVERYKVVVWFCFINNYNESFVNYYTRINWYIIVLKIFIHDLKLK